jgi:hypothetical protein
MENLKHTKQSQGGKLVSPIVVVAVELGENLTITSFEKQMECWSHCHDH